MPETIIDRAKAARWKNKAPPANGQVPPNGQVPSNGVMPAEPLPLVWFDECLPSLNSADFVEDLLIEETMSVVYGESGCGKTFFALDLALHVAAGVPWHGRDVKQGGVLYLALEGGKGVQNRVAAFKKTKQWNAAVLPFAIVPVSVNLLNPTADTARVIDTVKAVAGRMVVPVSHVVVDTLSRALCGGNENSPEDMGALVINADRIRETIKAHVQFVHHSGKDAARGARGHSLLRAATDTEIEVTRTIDLSVARVTKQKDLPGGDEIAFRLQSVNLGMNSRGKLVTSCVVAEAEGPTPGMGLKGDCKLAFEILSRLAHRDNELVPPTGHSPGQKYVPVESWRQEFYSRKSELLAESKKRVFNRCVKDLREMNIIETLNEYAWIVRSPGQPGQAGTSRDCPVPE